MPYLDKVHSISIIQTGMAAGYTMSLPMKDNTHYTKKRMLEEIVSLLGGRAAEYMIVDDVTSGASSDIERATGIARSMVTRYGMSDKLGPIQFGDDSNEVFIGRDLATARNYGEGIATAIDSEIKKIIDEAYDRAILIVKENMDILHKCAELLIEKEKITGDEFRELFPPEQLEAVKKEHIAIYGEEVVEAEGMDA
jgi:cell division protease FtsH